jgi:transposase-like protein
MQTCNWLQINMSFDEMELAPYADQPPVTGKVTRIFREHDFKVEMVRLVKKGAIPNEVARINNIPPQTLYNWIKAERAGNFESVCFSAAETEYLMRYCDSRIRMLERSTGKSDQVEIERALVEAIKEKLSLTCAADNYAEQKVHPKRRPRPLSRLQAVAISASTSDKDHRGVNLVIPEPNDEPNIIITETAEAITDITPEPSLSEAELWHREAEQRFGNDPAMTPWFCGDTQPVSIGYYERGLVDGVFRHYWNGRAWCFKRNGQRHWRQVGSYVVWRGLRRADQF